MNVFLTIFHQLFGAAIKWGEAEIASLTTAEKTEILNTMTQLMQQGQAKATAELTALANKTDPTNQLVDAVVAAIPIK
jgi:hypothetical protein